MFTPRSDAPTVERAGCDEAVEPLSLHPTAPGAEANADAEFLSAWVHTQARFPEIGTEFLGFHIETELGRGAFGRVYLARQGDLAARPVALKVACDMGDESQTLAQMQHTNIVPIYSFHRAGPFQAVCMPYYGRTTLAEVVGKLRGRASLPSSGRELRSTLNLHSDQTAPAAGSSIIAAHSTPTPGVLPSLPAAPDHARDGWSQLEGLSYVEAVLTLAGQMADGLAHAHARGILHRDLKPANVLLTDEGRPLLLDFNVAEDTKLRGSVEHAEIGGTLPYMAPEHMAAFCSAAGEVDSRCDLYGLGVILFELLTGRHPFPVRKGSSRETVPLMIADRNSPPGMRELNPAVPPSVESIIHKCLASDPAGRYQRAEDLREDIDRHLENLPLRHAPNPSWRERAGKWARRHPRLTSSGTIGAVAAVLILLLGAGGAYSWDRNRDIRARAALADHRTDFADAQLFLDDRNQSLPHLGEAEARLRAVLARYAVPDDGTEEWLRGEHVRRLPEAERERLRGDVGEAFYLMARLECLRARASDDPAARWASLDRAAKWNGAAARHAGDRLPRAVREQQAAIAELRGSRVGAENMRAEAERFPPNSARDLYLLGATLSQQGRHREAIPYLRQSTYLDPKNISAWFVRGTVHLALYHDAEAVACFTACLAIRDDFAPAWRNRGLARTRLRAFAEARDDFTRAIALDPRPADVYVQRAITGEVEGKLADAEADFSRALEAGADAVRVRLHRASIRARRGDQVGALADREEGLRLTPADEFGWVARGVERLPSDPRGALADAEEALKLNPFSVSALQLKAHVLGERLGRPDDALAVLNRAVELHPDHVELRAGRGVELARRGKREEALRDAREALVRDTRPPNLYQVGCIYALTSKSHAEDRKEAHHLLWSALKAGFGFDMIDTDPDLDPLRNDPDFIRMVATARAGYGAKRD